MSKDWYSAYKMIKKASGQIMQTDAGIHHVNF